MRSRLAEEICMRHSKTPITDYNTDERNGRFYVDCTFSTWMPLQAITHRMRKIVDKPADRSFRIVCNLTFLKSDKVFKL